MVYVAPKPLSPIHGLFLVELGGEGVEVGAGVCEGRGPKLGEAGEVPLLDVLWVCVDVDGEVEVVTQRHLLPNTWWLQHREAFDN